MRIAFASCICTQLFDDQPVWGRIAAAAPDHLVLLGDSIYLDIESTPHPERMSDQQFAQLLFLRYTELMAQPEFKALVRQLPAGHVHAIWDDHDFMWDGACGGFFRRSPVQRDKVRLSTGYLEAFRAALAQRLAPGSFPSAPGGPLDNPSQPDLSTPSLQLDTQLWLHLTDGRSFRTRTVFTAESKRTVLGAAQKARLEAAIRAAPEAVHLFASGSVLAGWKRYARDWAWLLALAAQQRMLVLSGDIHRNDLDAFFTGGWPLHEATSSGVAVRDAVTVGERQNNFGLLDIDDSTVTIRLFKGTRALPPRQLSRESWLPLP